MAEFANAGVVNERFPTDGSILVGVVEKERLETNAVLRLAVWLLLSDCAPIAVLKSPVWLNKNAFNPTAVLKVPSVLLRAALRPTAVLPLPPGWLLASVKAPMAVFQMPGYRGSKGALSLSRVEARVAAIRRRDNRLCQGRKPKADKQKWN